MSDDQIDDEAEQTKADRAWTAITDRRAVTAVFREFGVGSAI